MAEDYEVEAIIDDRITKDGVMEFKIRWKGYSPEDDTWQLKEDLVSLKFMILIG